MTKENTIYKKLFEIQGLAIKKGSDNPFFKSKYSSLDDIMEKLLPILKENNLVLTHYTKDGAVCTELVDVESGEKITSCISLGEGTPQQKGGEITYYKRYNTGQIFNITTEEDDDANRASSIDVKIANVDSVEKTNCQRCKKVLSNPKHGTKKNGEPYTMFTCDVCTQEYGGKKTPLATFV